MKRLILAVSMLALSLSGVRAVALTIEITKGADGGIPIAVVPFKWQGQSALPVEVGDIIAADLYRSGQFNPLPVDDFLSRPSDESEVKYKDWRLIKAVNLVVGRVTQMGTDRYAVRFQLFDVFRERQLAAFLWKVTGSDLRKIAHQISDKVYEALTGRPGAFDSRIAYVTLLRTASKGSEYQLMVADADGYNPKQILRSPDPILSPAWAADGAWLAYVSFEDGRSKIFVQNLNTGARKKLAEFPGINGAPAWSPDGKHMAMTLSRDGNPEIYVMHIASGSLRRLTNHSSIDTEAAWSPDGRHLVFTSDRAGRPQIYRISAAGGRAERLTFEGKENARASYDQAGKHLTLVTNHGNGDQIGVFSLPTGSLEILTDGRLDESPTFAPNGAMILYAAQRGGSGLLSAVSADGRVRQVLRSESGTVREPAWSSLNR
jgi:TolB protein|nr:Tol-Pal system beta propeller repeat protein TolB [Gammaproteobacteria bacterium]|tara:strand:+ start:406 stop:1701 length:1296 start_codon:yes stop_codon:yes gene_type:complete